MNIYLTEYSMSNAQRSMFKYACCKKYDLEDRLVNYTCRMIDVVEALPNSRAGNYMAGQLIKSCHSPAFNYGEMQAAESRADLFISLVFV